MTRVRVLAVVLAGIVALAAGIALYRTLHHVPRAAIQRYPMGWYTPGGRLSAEVDSGMRLAVYLGDSAAWIEAAAARGVKVIALPRPDLVRRFRASSAVYAWSLFDEPDHNDLPARFLHRLYSALKRADGRHPIAVTFTSDSLGCRISPGYWSSFDLLMYDEYPFYATPGLSETLPQVEEHYRSCVRFARRHHKLGPILVLQGFGDAPDGPSALWRWPNAAEQRILATSAARIGASGVLWWADYRANALTLHTVDALIARESVLLAKRHRFRKTT